MAAYHYSSSTLVEWIRTKVFKIEKPTALGWDEWDDWYEDTQKARPIGYFFTETLPKKLEWFPNHTVKYLDDARCYLQNRRHGSHYLGSSLKPGQYYEIETRILYSLFDSFADYIECEEAGSHIAWGDKELRKKYNIHWIYNWWYLNWMVPKFRCPQAGIDHLLWEMTLDVPPDPPDPHWQANVGQAGQQNVGQAKAAREKMALYTWWRHIRPSRGDAWDESGFGAFWKEMDAKYGDAMTPGRSKGKRRHSSWLGFGKRSKVLTAAENRKYAKLSEVKADLAQRWEEEDEAMLLRLIKMRKSLWT